jgi:PAS domain S-box-containing protein
MGQEISTVVKAMTESSAIADRIASSRPWRPDALEREDLRASQAELETALAAYQAIFDHSHDVICTIGADGLFTQVSRHAVEVWGYAAEALIGAPFMALVHSGDREATLAIYEQIREGQPTTAFRNCFVHKDGSAVPLMWSAAWSQERQAIFAIARDMRESVLAEKKLRQAQKLEAVGRLTGGVAHDFNNLLTIVVGAAEALVDSFAPGTDAHDLAQLTLQAGQRGADLVTSLLSFSRRRSLDPRPIDTRSLLASLEPLIRSALTGRIELAIAAHSTLACVADRAQLESTILNLVINARDAMADGGRLTIRTRADELDAGHVRNSGMTPGRYVRLTVADTGCGMDARTRERAMEPFFTTKDVGGGSGLGLASVYGFAQQSGGGLRLRSKPGHGTTVDLFLPATALAKPVAAPKLAAPKRRARTILVVEDDPMARAHLVRRLGALGHTVVPADSGSAALDVLGARDDIDLLLTDIMTPGPMNGRQLADHARLLRPGLKVLFTTGHSDDEVSRIGRAYSQEHLLRKPWRRTDLAARVEGAFGRA